MAGRPGRKTARSRGHLGNGLGRPRRSCSRLGRARRSSRQRSSSSSSSQSVQQHSAQEFPTQQCLLQPSLLPQQWHSAQQEHLPQQCMPSPQAPPLRPRLQHYQTPWTWIDACAELKRGQEKKTHTASSCRSGKPGPQKISALFGCLHHHHQLWHYPHQRLFSHYPHRFRKKR